jgi:hypothetical protein
VPWIDKPAWYYYSSIPYVGLLSRCVSRERIC